MDTYAVIKSRSESAKVYSELKKKGFSALLVSTPQNLKLGCGISILFDGKYGAYVKDVINVLGIRTFAGFYENLNSKFFK